MSPFVFKMADSPANMGFNENSCHGGALGLQVPLCDSRDSAGGSDAIMDSVSCPAQTELELATEIPCVSTV